MLLAALAAFAVTVQDAIGIAPDDAVRLQPVFTFRTDNPGAHTEAPQVDGSRLVVMTPFPHRVLAFELEQAPPALAWQYSPAANGMAAGLQCCGAPSGGMTVADGRVLLATQDGHVVLLQASDGNPLWDMVVANPAQGETLATPPLVAGAAVIVGSAGDDFGVRGWLAALDASSGRTLWKLFNTGPDAEVGIGPHFHPAHPQDAGSDLGVTSWPPGAWQQGGGGLDGPAVYDAAANLLIHATGHPAPWNPTTRPGENRWTAGLFARAADTGEALWYDAMNPHDQYALGAAGGLIAAEMDWQGSRRALLIHPDRNGHVYVLDRHTGEILSGEPFLPITASHGIDPKSGVPRPDAGMTVSTGSTTRDICPAWPAGAAAEPAFAVSTGLLYIPASRLCMDMAARDASYSPATPFTGATVRMRAAKGVSAGALIAWDVAAARPAWQIDEPTPLRGGVLATDDGTVFYGTLEGMLKAVDARSGAILWRARLGAGVVSRPTAFRGPDGRPWLAVLAGAGPLVGMPSASEIDPRDASALKGLAGLLHDLPVQRDRSGVLMLFRAP